MFDGLDWVYGETWRAYERIRAAAFKILVKSKNNIAKEFGASEYWFPSPSEHHQGDYIKSTNVLWEQCLEELNLDYVTPKTLRKEYHAYRYYGLDRAMGLEDNHLELNTENVAILSS